MAAFRYALVVPFADELEMLIGASDCFGCKVADIQIGEMSAKVQGTTHRCQLIQLLLCERCVRTLAPFRGEGRRNRQS